MTHDTDTLISDTFLLLARKIEAVCNSGVKVVLYKCEEVIRRQRLCAGPWQGVVILCFESPFIKCQAFALIFRPEFIPTHQKFICYLFGLDQLSSSSPERQQHTL